MDIKTIKSRNWIVILSLLVITGCVAPAERITELQPRAIKQGSKVGVVWIGPCTDQDACETPGSASKSAQFAPDGASGLLSLGIILSAHRDVSNALIEVSADSIVEAKFLNPVAKALVGKGAAPSVSTSFHYWDDLPKAGKHSIMRMKETLDKLHPGDSTSPYHGIGFDQPYDLSAIANELGSTTLVVLDVQQFGVRRSFGPLSVPLGRPYGLSLVRAFVWDVATSSVLYSDFAIARSDIGGNWREVGDWTQVYTATNTALELAIDRAAKPLIAAIKSQ